MSTASDSNQSAGANSQSDIQEPSLAEAHRLSMKFHVGSEYKLIREIGSGSFGDVVLAIHRQTGRRVAIKKIAQIFQIQAEAKRQLRELTLLRQL